MPSSCRTRVQYACLSADVRVCVCAAGPSYVNGVDLLLTQSVSQVQQCSPGSGYSSSGCSWQCLCGGSSYITITKMEIWTHQAPPSPPTSPPQVPWAFFHHQRLSGLGIDVSSFTLKCFDRSIHGTAAGKWHANCKDLGPTIMLLELTNGKLLGAYLSVALTDVPTYDQFGNQNGANNRGWTPDNHAFLFSLPTAGTPGSAIKLPVRSSSYATNQRPDTSAHAQLLCGVQRGGVEWGWRAL